MHMYIIFIAYMSVVLLLFVSYCSGFVLIGLFFGLLLFWSWVIIGSCCGLTSPVCKIFIYVTRCLRIPMNFLYRIGGDRVHACRVASLSRHGCAHSEKEKRGLPDGTAPSAYRTMVRHGRDWLGLVGSGRVGCGLLGSSRVGKGLVPTSCFGRSCVAKRLGRREGMIVVMGRGCCFFAFGDGGNWDL